VLEGGEGLEKIDSTEDVDLLTGTGCSENKNTCSFNLLTPTGYVMHQQFNLSNPTGYAMHQQFNLSNPTGYVMHQHFTF
jgi:hypothetical protein